MGRAASDLGIGGVDGKGGDGKCLDSKAYSLTECRRHDVSVRVVRCWNNGGGRPWRCSRAE